MAEQETTFNGPRLGEAIRRRRLELGFTQAEAAERAKVSLATWSVLERGVHTSAPSDRAAAGVCRALGWESGSIELVSAGGAPRLAGAPQVAASAFEAAVAADPLLDEGARSLLRQLYGRLAGKERDGV